MFIKEISKETIKTSRTDLLNNPLSNLQQVKGPVHHSSPKSDLLLVNSLSNVLQQVSSPNSDRQQVSNHNKDLLLLRSRDLHNQIMHNEISNWKGLIKTVIREHKIIIAHNSNVAVAVEVITDRVEEVDQEEAGVEEEDKTPNKIINFISIC